MLFNIVSNFTHKVANSTTLRKELQFVTNKKPRVETQGVFNQLCYMSIQIYNFYAKLY